MFLTTCSFPQKWKALIYDFWGHAGWTCGSDQTTCWWHFSSISKLRHDVFPTLSQVRFTLIGSSNRCPSCIMWLTNQRGILSSHSLFTFALFCPQAELNRKFQSLLAHIYACQIQLSLWLAQAVSWVSLDGRICSALVDVVVVVGVRMYLVVKSF